MGHIIIYDKEVIGLAPKGLTRPNRRIILALWTGRRRRMPRMTRRPEKELEGNQALISLIVRIRKVLGDQKDTRGKEAPISEEEARNDKPE